MNKLLLMGNPNVGKSSIFSRITGVNVVASNYPGTTVEFSEGKLDYMGKKRKVIDVPGVYSLDPETPAGEVAIEMLESAEKKENAVVVNIIDATNLERNLNLTIQLLRRDVPVIILLNFWDETQHVGISIDHEKLEEILGVPVIPVVGVTGQGIKKFVDRIRDAKNINFTIPVENSWNYIGKVVNKVQKLYHKHHTIRDRFEELTIHHWTGLPIALIILLLSFFVIRTIGESLIGFVLEPAFEVLWKPIMMRLSELLGGEGILHSILIGNLINGSIDFEQSFGLLTTGLYVPISAVLPYVLAFYFVLSFLEDSGYLTRLGVLLDRIMHIIGLHGMSFLPFLLGLGCNVPGAMSTRLLATRKERFIAATLMGIVTPCMAQTAMVIGLVGQYGIRGLGPIFLTLVVVGLVLGMIMKNIVKGESPEIFTEIPRLRFPHLLNLFKKLWMRIKHFLKEAIPYVLLGVFIVNLLYSLHIIDFIGNIAQPVVTKILGLPKEAVGALIMGFLRKDLAVGMLVPLGMNLKQLIIASVVLTMYFPCIATFTILVKELGVKDMFKAALIMVITSFSVGGILNLIL
jgi:ferrous iron transport protein B